MAKKLVVLAGPDEGRVIAIEEETVLIGRSRAAGVHLIDPHVSRVHCQVTTEKNQSMLVDFDSAGGTFVNGVAIEKHPLKPGDLIRIGATRLQYLEDYVGEIAAPTPAKPVGSWASELVGQSFGHFEIGQPIARGKDGYVFHGRDTRTDAPIAMKVLRADFSDSDKNVKHFVEAMKTVMPLQHPHLIKVFSAGKTGPHCWMAEEYVAGDSLSAVIGRSEKVGRIDWRLVVRVGVYLARALEYAHAKDLLHLNVTPQNILVGKLPQDTKLTDLMLADATEEDPTKPISAAGLPSESLPYMSPERTDRGAKMDVRTDLYSLGATLYAALTGKPPFEGDSVPDLIEQIRLDSPTSLKALSALVPDRFTRALRQALAKRPQDRPASATVLKTELEAIAKENKLSL
jgi:serine/threonine protein kinase